MSPNSVWKKRYFPIRSFSAKFLTSTLAFPWAVTAVRGTHYCLRKIDYPLIWKLLKTENITHFNAAPTVNTLLCASKDASKLPNPVRVTVAASPPTAHLFEQMTNLNLYPVHVYGLTETYGPITKGYHMPVWDTLPLKEKYARMARQGHGFITGLPIRIIKPDQPDDVLIDVAKDGKEIGEIIFFGNICAKEYLKDDEATRKLFAGGALHSGDLAVWHEDGSAQILDRAKDIIISGLCPVPFSFPYLPPSSFHFTDVRFSRRRKHLLRRPGSNACATSLRPRSRRSGGIRFPLGRTSKGLHHRQRREGNERRGTDRVGEARECN